MLQYGKLSELYRYLEYSPRAVACYITSLYLECSPLCRPKCFRFFRFPRSSEVSCNTEQRYSVAHTNLLLVLSLQSARNSTFSTPRGPTTGRMTTGLQLYASRLLRICLSSLHACRVSIRLSPV
jgi:hypothetical protein